MTEDVNPADIVIRDVTALTMEHQAPVVDNGYIGVRGKSIVAVAEGSPPDELMGPETKMIEGRGGLVTPGFISTHQHVIDVLLRGLSQERELLEWSYTVYYPGTTAFEPEDVSSAVLVAMAEGLRAGITTVVDNWSASLDPVLSRDSAEAALDAYRRSGVRVVFARMFSDAAPPSSWFPLIRAFGGDPETGVEDTDEALVAIEELAAAHHASADGRISICAAPATVQTTSAAGLRGAAALAERFGTIVTIHHCETRREARVLQETGGEITGTEYLSRLGLLGPSLVAAHCVWLEDRDVDLLATSETRVAHCPSSNMMLASGIAPIRSLLRAGVLVGLGCDNAMLNNNVSLLGEARLASLLAKVSSGDAGALTAQRALELATREGARVLGRGDEIGTIAVGRRADLVLFDTAGPHWTPIHHPANALVYQAHPDDVRSVLVDGRVLLEDRQLTWADPATERELIAAARRRAVAIRQRSGLSELGT